MTGSLLSPEASPPLRVPVRFLVTAPLFGVLFAIFLAAQGPAVLLSRWMPGLLGASHLLALGFLAVAMFGALQQLLPVLVGAPLAHARRGSPLILALLVTGTLLLAGGVSGIAGTWAAGGGAALLLVAVALFVGSVLVGLARSRVRDATSAAILLAILSLSVTTLLGAWLALGYLDAGYPLMRGWTDLHLAWGLFGWVGLLIAAVTVHVVPMFQVTPAFPRWFHQGFAPAVFLLLVLYTAVHAGFVGGTAWAVLKAGVEAGLALAFAGFALLTLRRLAQRRRRQSDAALAFWFLGMGSLIAAVVLFAIVRISPAAAAQPALGLALGWLFIAGFAISIVNGMLYKIVPFLVWLHLNQAQSSAGLRGIRIPNLHDAIPARSMGVQWLLHLTGLVLGLAALWQAAAFHPAVAAFGASSALLFLNLVHALRRYAQAARAIAAAAYPTR